MWMFLQLRNHENHLHLFLKPDSNVDLGVEESYGAKGENAKHSKSCPVDIPVMITVMGSVRVMASLGQLTTYLGMGAVAIIMMVSVKVMVMIRVTQHISTMTQSHHGGEMSVMMKVGMCQCQKPTIHHDEFDFRVHICIR